MLCEGLELPDAVLELLDGVNLRIRELEASSVRAWSFPMLSPRRSTEAIFMAWRLRMSSVGRWSSPMPTPSCPTASIFVSERLRSSYLRSEKFFMLLDR